MQPLQVLHGLGMEHSRGPAGGCCTCLHWCNLCVALPRQSICPFPETRDGRPSCIPSLSLHPPLAQTISSCPTLCARDARAAFSAQLVQPRIPKTQDASYKLSVRLQPWLAPVLPVTKPLRAITQVDPISSNGEHEKQLTRLRQPLEGWASSTRSSPSSHLRLEDPP